MVTSIWVLSSLMATPHMQLRHLLHYDDNGRKSSHLPPWLEAKVGAGARFRAVQMFPDASACPRLCCERFHVRRLAVCIPLESSANERCPRVDAPVHRPWLPP